MYRVMCYGDSNTYGYDARDPFGGRLPAASRWPELCCTGWETINAGMNGREIPHSACEYQLLDALLEQYAPLDALVIMLGTNDLLNLYPSGGAAAEERMEQLLKYLTVHPVLVRYQTRLLLVAPPPLALSDGLDGQRCTRQFCAFARSCESIAARHSAVFASAGELPLQYDGVHLSENGHRLLAERLRPVLDALLTTK